MPENNTAPAATEHPVTSRRGPLGGSVVTCKGHDTPITTSRGRSIVSGGGSACDATSGVSLLAGTIDKGHASIMSPLGTTAAAVYLETIKSKRMTIATDVSGSGSPVASGIVKVSVHGLLGTIVAPSGTPIVSVGGSTCDTPTGDALTTT